MDDSGRGSQRKQYNTINSRIASLEEHYGRQVTSNEHLALQSLPLEGLYDTSPAGQEIYRLLQKYEHDQDFSVLEEAGRLLWESITDPNFGTNYQPPPSEPSAPCSPSYYSGLLDELAWQVTHPEESNSQATLAAEEQVTNTVVDGDDGDHLVTQGLPRQTLPYPSEVINSIFEDQGDPEPVPPKADEGKQILTAGANLRLQPNPYRTKSPIEARDVHAIAAPPLHESRLAPNPYGYDNFPPRVHPQDTRAQLTTVPRPIQVFNFSSNPSNHNPSQAPRPLPVNGPQPLYTTSSFTQNALSLNPSQAPRPPPVNGPRPLHATSNFTQNTLSLNPSQAPRPPPVNGPRSLHATSNFTQNALSLNPSQAPRPPPVNGPRSLHATSNFTQNASNLPSRPPVQDCVVDPSLLQPSPNNAYGYPRPPYQPPVGQPNPILSSNHIPRLNPSPYGDCNYSSPWFQDPRATPQIYHSLNAIPNSNFTTPVLQSPSPDPRATSQIYHSLNAIPNSNSTTPVLQSPPLDPGAATMPPYQFQFTSALPFDFYPTFVPNTTSQNFTYQPSTQPQYLLPQSSSSTIAVDPRPRPRPRPRPPPASASAPAPASAPAQPVPILTNSQHNVMVRKAPGRPRKRKEGDMN